MAAHIIAFRERTWMDHKADYRQWDHLCRSMDATLQLITNWNEVSIPSGYEIVIMDEPGEQSLQEFNHPQDAVYIFGRSGLNNLEKQLEVNADHIVRIDTLQPICLFGVVAAGMVLYDRMQKQ